MAIDRQELEALQAAAEQLAFRSSALLTRITRDFDAGDLPDKAVLKALTTLNKLTSRPYQAIYRARKNLVDRITKNRRRERADNWNRTLAAPAPACPLCTDFKADTMQDLVNHLRAKHGWPTYVQSGSKRYGTKGVGLCGCGGCIIHSYRQVERDAELAKHLLKQKDLGEHLAMAALKMSAQE